MIGAVDSIPILIASAPKSESTESICRATNSGGRLNTPWTPSEFWAVTAVTTDMPKTRNAENVLRSAWMPAPPPESDPAMVRAFGTVIDLRSIRRPALRPADRSRPSTSPRGVDHHHELAARRRRAQALEVRGGRRAHDLLELLGELARDDDLGVAEDLRDRLEGRHDPVR